MMPPSRMQKLKVDTMIASLEQDRIQAESERKIAERLRREVETLQNQIQEERQRLQEQKSKLMEEARYEMAFVTARDIWNHCDRW